MLKFTPLSSAVDASFWQSLATKKLDILKLSQEALVIQGHYSFPTTATDQQGQTVLMPSHFFIPSHGLDNTQDKDGIKGTLINTNTVEAFRTIDKNQLFQEATLKIKEAVESGEALKDPKKLYHYLLLTFADLKKYKFYYWFAFPAIIPDQDGWQLDHQQNLTSEQASVLHTAYQGQYYFLIKKETERMQILSLDAFEKNDQTIWFAFLDPSPVKGSPGWPLRNLLYLIYTVWGLKKVRILCYRQSDPYLIDASLPEHCSYQTTKSVGWERNVQGKLGPRMADLGPLMDPARLADTAIDLNLKLMRWRLMPELDLDKIKQTKCLLLGAGTLGCYVARCLMGWGVRHITFVDSGTVSYSNPVRQPLYRFQDKGKPKAQTAAEQLLEIQPTLVAKGYDLTIPMPGHTHNHLDQDLTTLTELIKEHDVIFLLTDSRESRWLPTLIGTKLNKWIINSALGFDSYLVMRHGTRQNQMGCYFCNDIVAPTDSLTDRTLDQQCTVTRPGLAAIAGALAVELMVSLLQDPKGIHAEASTNASNSSAGSILGLLPHQIRGFLGQFNNLLIVGQSYDKCTACSDKVLEAYSQDPLSFVQKVLDDPIYLEDITGLSALKAESENVLDDWTVGEDDF
ncbi:E1-like protein-activating enzyme Gsa7p/Apg7p [Rhizopus microsporus var. microsporus]|uniref:Ubiquitin-like modifier-activating enzyme ATG7 n=2 Tax=Rhizopus microsporus TaxID=58291 RepID=A0A2G4SNN2_RHIZD|nr:E1-like protein-activating [Rhizopus microsporus ATCC 52813]ORE09599.1 E1-like protein-activating enzyme Gsa7p/Apg7p [Rhizopus microsporus var. microsporus]PHZ10352.1 E1-like protein-activating [Rhizopus microsporus ATCC 52813]